MASGVKGILVEYAVFLYQQERDGARWRESHLIPTIWVFPQIRRKRITSLMRWLSILVSEPSEITIYSGYLGIFLFVVWTLQSPWCVQIFRSTPQEFRSVSLKWGPRNHVPELFVIDSWWNKVLGPEHQSTLLLRALDSSPAVFTKQDILGYFLKFW